jgi:nucleotide-binding universal stress UspA family protein
MAFASPCTMQPLIWRTILVPHDFSASANHAAAIARDEAKAHDGRLVLLHVVEIPSHFGPDTTMILPSAETPIGMREYAVSSATAHLDDIADRLAKDGVKVETVVRVGNPVDEIAQAAAELCANVIVMGTHGRAGIRRLVAGSVAERVVRTSNIPVLTIRHAD